MIKPEFYLQAFKIELKERKNDKKLPYLKPNNVYDNGILLSHINDITRNLNSKYPRLENQIEKLNYKTDQIFKQLNESNNSSINNLKREIDLFKNEIQDFFITTNDSIDNLDKESINYNNSVHQLRKHLTLIEEKIKNLDNRTDGLFLEKEIIIKNL